MTRDHDDTGLRQLTYSLYRGVQLDRALERARTRLDDPIVVELLAALLERDTTSYAQASRCLDLLAGARLELAHAAVSRATTHRFAKLRLAAVEKLGTHPQPPPWRALIAQLRHEPDYHVRAALVRLIAAAPEPLCKEVLVASDDPHWRVRMALLSVLHTWRLPADTLRELLRARDMNDARSQGLLAYHARTLDPTLPDPPVAQHRDTHEPDLSARSWWSAEPTLMVQRIRGLAREQVLEESPWLVWLLASPDETLRAAVMSKVTRGLTRQGLLSFLIMACEPRRHDIAATRRACLARTSHDLIETCAWAILEASQDGSVRLTDLARIPGVITPTHRLVTWAARWLERHVVSSYGAGDRHALWTQMSAHASHEEPPNRAPLMASPSSLKDDAYLACLKEDPCQERSWLVLAEAARRGRYRLEAHVPASWTDLDACGGVRVPVAVHDEAPRPHDVCEHLTGSAPWWEPVPLGGTGLHVSRMGISGHYALPERGFELALDHGINTFFWEPIYLSQTRAFRAMHASRKAELVMCCGTFEATAAGLRRDLERALRAMALEQVQVFYIFWVRDVERLSDELLEEMARCVKLGMVHSFGVSTHSRALARRFVETWPAIMVRHNAAHTGIEQDVLPFVDPSKTGITTFSNLCYGRMISAIPGWDEPAPSAQDAYRYSLSQPGVTSCWSAPSTLAQLGQNLRALEQGPMTSDELSALRRYGQALYLRNKRFDALVRSR